MKPLVSFCSVLFLLALQSLPAWAHTRLMFSAPAQDASLTQSPKTVMLHFNEPVRMLSLELKSDKDVIEFGFNRNTKASEHVEFELPHLTTGSYQFAWAALGSDGHRVNGEIPFTISLSD